VYEKHVYSSRVLLNSPVIFMETREINRKPDTASLHPAFQCLLNMVLIFLVSRLRGRSLGLRERSSLDIGQVYAISLRDLLRVTRISVRQEITFDKVFYSFNYSLQMDQQSQHG
jgi:hypothetical protein